MNNHLSLQGGSKDLPAGVHIPSHGHGYLKPVQPGEVRNPTGKGGLWREAQRIAREKSPEATRRLVDLMNSSDERVALMAADKVLTWAWGKPQEHDPNQERTATGIDVSVLSHDERKQLLSWLRRGLVREGTDLEPTAGPTVIEGKAE